MTKIKLLKDVDGYMMTFKKGRVLEENEPYQGFNDDESFTICQGMGIYINVEKKDYEKIIEKNISVGTTDYNISVGTTEYERGDQIRPDSSGVICETLKEMERHDNVPETTKSLV
jgi:hypothetical protein